VRLFLHNFMDFATFQIFLAGCTAGIITGIVPGLGPAHLLALLYLWMTGWSPIHLMVFYVAYITISNFVDAIPSLYFGVPGEVSAIPASRESQRLAELGLTGQAIKLSAIGRTIGSLIALSTSVYLIQWLLSIPEIFASRWQMVFYLITVICIAIAGRNSWWINALMMLVGFTISLIGYNYYTETVYLTGGWTDLYSGVPLLPLLIGIYVIPQLLAAPAIRKKFDYNVQVKSQGLYIPSMLRGTAVGYVLGLVPGMSYILGSTAAYNFERWWHQKFQKKNDISVAAVVASETASNTGSMTVLIPLLLFGMPIIASEAIIYDLMVDAGAVFSLGSFLITNYVILAQWFVIACVIGMIMSWPIADQFRKLSERLLDPRFIWILIGLILFSAGIEAYHSQKIALYSAVFVTSLIAGWLLRKFDVMPLVFVFVLGSSFQSIAYNLLQLYF